MTNRDRDGRPNNQQGERRDLMTNREREERPNDQQGERGET